jgi:hypothetical protein
MELRSRDVVKPGGLVLKALHCAAMNVAKHQRDSGMTYRSWFAIAKPDYNGVAIAAFRRCIEYSETAEAFLNCGHVELAAAGREWARVRGYSIQSGFGAHPISWGAL